MRWLMAELCLETAYPVGVDVVLPFDMVAFSWLFGVLADTLQSVCYA